MLRFKNTAVVMAVVATLSLNLPASFAKEKGVPMGGVSTKKSGKEKQIGKPVLFYSPGACSLAVRMLGHEVGYEMDYKKVDLHTHKTEAGKDYYTINPKGSVPALWLSNHSVLTENCAVLQYVADMGKKKELSHSVGDMRRYRDAEACNFVATELHQKIGMLFSPGYSASKDFTEKMLHSKLAYMDNLLSKQKYLSGNKMSYADMYSFVSLFEMQSFLKLDLSKYTNIMRYYQEIGKKHSVVNALNAEGLKM